MTQQVHDQPMTRLKIQGALVARTDMSTRLGEAWRPRVFGATNTWTRRSIAAVRRLLDLQAGTIWRDLSALLPQCRGLVVDAGCGAQPYRALFGKEARYLGIDSSDAQAHFGYEFPDTVYFHGDRWPLEDGVANAVLCTETLEHIPDPAGFLSEVARVLRPQGVLILTVPFAARYHFIPHDYWRFTPACLRRILVAAGFSSIAIYARGNALTVACYKAMALILPLLFATVPSAAVRAFRVVMGIVLVPAIVVLAGIANLSTLGRGGDDCLGYTIVAYRNVDQNVLDDPAVSAHHAD